MSFYNRKEVRSLLNSDKDLRLLREFVASNPKAKEAFQNTIGTLLSMQEEIDNLQDEISNLQISIDEVEEELAGCY